MVSDHSSAVSVATPLASAKALKWEARLWRESGEHRPPGLRPGPMLRGGHGGPVPGGRRELGTPFPPPHVSPVPLRAGVELRTQHCHQRGQGSLEVTKGTWSLQRRGDWLTSTLLFMGGSAGAVASLGAEASIPNLCSPCSAGCAASRFLLLRGLYILMINLN